MSTALAVREKNEIQTHMGSKAQISAIRDRILAMIPGAAEAPQDVQWAAAQIAVAHGLDPLNGELYIMKIGSKKQGNQWVDDWRAHIGVKGLRKLARKQANFMTDARIMDAAEVKAQRRELYDADDIGVEMTLWRLDVAMQCKQIGIPYQPIKAYGFWRVKAQMNHREKKWMPDSIPNTWTAQMVAEKRAEINAIKQAFDMAFDVADPSQDYVIEEMAHRLEVVDRDAAPVNGNGLHPDDDMLFAGEPNRTPRAPIESEEIDEIYDAIVEADETPEDEPADDAPELAAPGQVKAIVSLCQAKHGNEADEFMAAICNDHGVNMIDQLTGKQAATIIATLNRLPAAKTAKQPA